MFQKWLDETHGTQFELLRLFLGRFFDSEWVTAPGEFLQVALGPLALLPIAWLMMWLVYIERYLSLHQYRRRAEYLAAVREDQLWLLAVAMCVTAALTALQWQALFPSGRDYLVLAGMPATPAEIFLGKLGALLVVFSGFVIVLNVPAGVLFAGINAGRWQENPSSLAHAFALAAAGIAACAFVFFTIVAVQGVLLNLLPVRLFTAVSAYAQAMLLAGSLGVLPWLAGRPGTFAWWAPQWFLDLWAWLEGAHDGSSGAGLGALAVAIASALAMYLLSYRRWQRLVLEIPRARGLCGFYGPGQQPAQREAAIDETRRCPTARRPGDAHMHMVRHQVPFYDLALFLLRQRMEDRTEVPTRLTKDGLSSSFRHENYMVLAVPFRMG